MQRTYVFKNLKRAMLLLIPLYFLLSSQTIGQTVCDPSVLVGDNLVTNGGFESGDTGFSTNISCSWNAPACSCHNNSYSQPNQYYIGNSPDEASPCGGIFQSGFVGSPHSGTKFMMVDGTGSTSPTVWQQTVNVDANSYYYFQVWISTIGTSPATLAKLKFEIAGVLQDTVIDAPAAVNTWEAYTQIWYSGATSGAITIKIKDIQPASSGANQDDFGLDDIVFKKGCPPEAYALQPELGPNQTLCGTNGTITLDPNVTLAANNDIWWSTGTNDGDATINVTTGGMYYVCVNQDGECTKVDSIHINNDYSIDLGNDVELCDPAQVTLDAVHSGLGVSYRWYKDDVAIVGGTGRTQFVNSSGEYKVVVSDTSCGDKADSVNVTIKAGQPIPNNVDFCLTANPDTTITFSVSPPGTNYNWYDVETGGSVLAGGAGTDTYTKSGIVLGDTLWVKDLTHSTYPPTGPVNTGSATPGWGYGADDYNRLFNALTNIKIITVDMKPEFQQGPCVGKNAGQTSASITIELHQAGVATGQSYSTTMTCGSFNSIPLNFNVTPGNNYELVVAGGPGWFHRNTTETSTYTITDIMEIQASANSGAFFNWDISAESTCGRTPVMARDMCILPVSFLYVQAAPKGNTVVIQWATVQEENNHHFEVQRMDGNNEFRAIAHIPGKGNSSSIHQYSFTDYDANTGVGYYRIKQVDFDGQSSYSEIISVSNHGWGVYLHTDYEQNNFRLLLKSDEDKQFYISIANATGRVISQFTTRDSVVSLEHLNQKGLYLISVTDGEVRKVLKFSR